MSVQLFAVDPGGPVSLPVAEGARSVHELFDSLPLGVYSALRTYQHERFLGLELHFERTDRSMALLGWPERLDRPLLRRAIDQCVRAYPGPEACVRFDVLAGVAPALGNSGRTLLALAPLIPVPAAYLREGVVVRLSPLRRARPLIKAASFVVERRPFPLGHLEAYEHLIVDAEQRILEGSSSNFLALQEDTLRVTGEEALQGITQRILIDLARGLGLEVVRQPLRLDELARVDEAFLSGSTRGIVPVAAVEEQRIGRRTPGPWTQRLSAAYQAHAQTHARRAVALEDEPFAHPMGLENEAP